MKTIEQIQEFFEGDTFACGNNIDIISVTEEAAVVEVRVQSHQKNAMKAAQGGLIFTLADFAFAVHSNRKEGINAVTQSASISYLSPAVNEMLVATARPIKEGRKTCVYNIEVSDEKGRQIANVTVNGFIVT